MAQLMLPIVDLDAFLHSPTSEQARVEADKVSLPTSPFTLRLRAHRLVAPSRALTHRLC